MRNLENQLRRMAAKQLIKLVDSAYKVKQTVEQSIKLKTLNLITLKLTILF